MKLTITRPAAEEIVKYYDFTGNGDMQYQEFLADVATFVKPVLHFVDITPAERAAYIDSIARNPFMPKPFKAPPNKILETFKKRMTQAATEIWTTLISAKRLDLSISLAPQPGFSLAFPV